MRPIKLTISGFKAFKKPTTLLFPKRSGLFLMTGTNSHPKRQRLGRNAIGKSTVWDALCWVLYGKTVRGVRGPALQSWGTSDSPKGKVILVAGGKRLVVRRVVKPKMIVTVDGEQVDQSRLDSLLGLDHSGFLSTIVFGQFNLSFFDLTATEKLNVLTEYLDLGQWMEAAERAKAAVKKLEAEDREAADEEVRLTERRRGLLESLDRLAAARKAAEKDRKARMTEMEARLKEEKSRADAASIEASALRQSRVALQGEIARAEQALADAVAKQSEHQRVVNQLDSDLRQSRRDCSELKSRIRAFKELEDGDCPTCSQRVGEEHVVAVLAKLRSERDWCVGERDKIKKRLATEQEAQVVLDEQATARLMTSTKLGAKLAGLDAQEDAAVKRYGYLLRNVTEWSAELIRLKAEAGKEERKEDEARLRELEARLESHSKTRAESIRVLQAAHFWTTGFKGLRLWLIEQALQELEVDTNSALADLGLIDWQVRFQIERDPDAGDIAKGFHVLIKSPDAQDFACWESWSGGETGRLRIAGAAGLASLITRRRGLPASLEVWDEPTQHLSAEGIDDLLEFLWSRAEERQVWLVDHRTLDAGRFAGQVLIERTEEGSAILPPVWASEVS